MSGLGRTDRTSRNFYKQNSSRSMGSSRGSKNDRSTYLLQKRTGSMRQLFERRDSGLTSTQHTKFTQETQTTAQTQEGGFDDIHPSDHVVIFDEEQYEGSERTYTTATTDEDTNSYDTVDVVIQEVMNAASAATAATEARKKKKSKSSSRRTKPCTGGTHKTVKTSTSNKKQPQTDVSPRIIRPRKAQLKEEKSERNSLVDPEAPRRSTADIPSPRTTKLTVSKDASSTTSKAIQMIMEAMERNRQSSSTGRQRSNSTGRRFQSKAISSKRRTSLGSNMDRRKGNHTDTTASSCSQSSKDNQASPRHSNAPLRQRCVESPIKRNSITKSTCRHASPIPKTKMVPMFPLSPRRTPSPLKDQCRADDISFCPPATIHQKWGNESDSRIRYSHRIGSDVTVADETMSSTTPLTERRLRSRHPKRHADVLDMHRRVVPQRSRSLTDMRDMLRPKSDPRHRPRQTLNQKEGLNPLDTFFNSQVVLPPPSKDSQHVIDTTLGGVTAKRPLARRMVRHKAINRFKSTFNETPPSERFDEITVTTATTDPVLVPHEPRRRVAPQRSRSLTDMREMALHTFFKKDDPPSVVEYKKPTEWKTYFTSRMLAS